MYLAVLSFLAWKQIFLADLDGFSHRDRHLEQQETEKIESEVRDVYRIRSMRCVMYASAQGGLLGGHKSTPVKHNQILFPPACSSPLITGALPGS